MRDLPTELSEAAQAGDYHKYLAIKIDQMEALHEAGKKADPRYSGDEMVTMIEMMKAVDLALWQCKETLGYSIPHAVDERYPRSLAGNSGENPFQCGPCEARKRYPDLHLRSDAERHGGMYVSPDDFKKA